MGERRRREAAQSETAGAVLAYVHGDDASMYNLLDGPARSDALGLALRLASLAGTALARLAAAEGVDPEVALATLLEHPEAGGAAELVEAVDLGVVWEPNAPEAVLVTSDGDLTILALRARSDDPDTRCVVLTWTGSVCASMAPPNDEAIATHRLWYKGLDEVLWAGVVHRSALIEGLTHSTATTACLVHHVLPLKECVVEVVARGLTVTRTDGATAEAALRTLAERGSAPTTPG